MSQNVPQIPGVELLRPIGRGAMGAVWLGRQTVLNRAVAVKQILGAWNGDPEMLERFQREARALARMNHQNVVGIYDLTAAGADLFMIQEFVDGPTLRQLLEAGMLTHPQALRVIGELAAALTYAARQGILHRDLKPGNVFVTRQGVCKLGDFGLVKLLSSQAGFQTQAGTVLGTPAYMSPEQARGTGQVDQRTDVYALAVMAYELLLGRLPFPSVPGNPIASLEAHISAPPPRPSQLAPGFPRKVEEALLRGLEKDPAKRYGSAADLHQALARAAAASGPAFAGDPDLGPRAAAAAGPPPADAGIAAAFAPAPPPLTVAPGVPQGTPGFAPPPEPPMVAPAPLAGAETIVRPAAAAGEETVVRATSPEPVADETMVRMPPPAMMADETLVRMPPPATSDETLVRMSPPATSAEAMVRMPAAEPDQTVVRPPAPPDPNLVHALNSSLERTTVGPPEAPPVVMPPAPPAPPVTAPLPPPVVMAPHPQAPPPATPPPPQPMSPVAWASAPVATPVYSPPKAARRTPLPAILVGAVVLLAVAVGGFFLLTGHHGGGAAGPLAVTAVSAQLAPDSAAVGHCPQATWTFVGDITTNGQEGTVSYYWTRPDGHRTDVKTDSVNHGQTADNPTFTFQLSSDHGYTGTAMLHLTAPTQASSAPISVEIACP